MLPVTGVRAITYMVTCPDKQIVLSVLCSLLNTVRRHLSVQAILKLTIYRPSNTILLPGASRMIMSYLEIPDRF